MKKKKTTFTLVLEAGNGFIRRMEVKQVMDIIHIPFFYRIRIASPVLSDHVDLDATPAGVFKLYRRTKTCWFYRLSNVAEVANPKFIPT